LILRSYQYQTYSSSYNTAYTVACKTYYTIPVYRGAPELISGPSLGTRVKFNRTQSRVVTGLLTGHNTLRRHLYLLGLLDSPMYEGCGVKEKTSAHILCECEALASLRHMYLGSFFLEPEDIKSIGLGAIWSFGEPTGLP
jgi:hypothetical protein